MAIRFATAAAVFVAFASPLSQAAPVTLIVEGTQTSYFDSDNYLPFADSGIGASWTMTITYDSETVDIFGPDRPPFFPEEPNLGIFSDAISDMTLKIGSQTFGKLESGTVLVVNDYLDTSTGDYVDNWVASTGTSTPLSDFDQSLGDYPLEQNESFVFAAYSTGSAPPVGPLNNKLLEPPGPLNLWEGTVLSYSVRLRDNIADSDTELARAEAIVTGVTVVPIPAAVWLFASALALCGGLVRRCSAGHRHRPRG